MLQNFGVKFHNRKAGGKSCLDENFLTCPVFNIFAKKFSPTFNGSNERYWKALHFQHRILQNNSNFNQILHKSNAFANICIIVEKSAHERKDSFAIFFMFLVVVSFVPSQSDEVLFQYLLPVLLQCARAGIVKVLMF